MAEVETKSVRNFVSKIGQTGLASPNKFEVTFGKLPEGVLEGNGDGQTKIARETLSLMCESAALAGRQVQSMLDRQYGVNREVAYNGPQYTPITLSFLCSSNYAEKKFFDRWNNKIVNISKGWDVAYYDHYVGEMSVKALGRDGETIIHHTEYHECFPKSVQAIELGHSLVNNTVRLTVEMSYAYWTTKDQLETNTNEGFQFPKIIDPKTK